MCTHQFYKWVLSDICGHILQINIFNFRLNCYKIHILQTKWPSRNRKGSMRISIDIGRSISNKWAAPWENQQSAKAKTKAQISFAVTAKLISAFVFATQIVQFLFYLNPKFQASSSFLCLYRPVCVRPVRKPHCWFSHEVAQTNVLSVSHDPKEWFESLLLSL